MDREFPTEREYFNGVRDDGSPLPYHSRHLYPGPTKIWTDDPLDLEHKNPADMTAEECRYLVKQQEFEDLEKVRRTAHEMIDLGMAAARSAPSARDASPGHPGTADIDTSTAEPAAEAAGESPGGVRSDAEAGHHASPAASAAGLADADVDASTSADRALDLRARASMPRIPGGKPAPATKLPKLAEKLQRACDPAGETPATRAGRLPAPPQPLKPEAGLVMAQRGCKMLMDIAPRRTAVANELITMAAGLEIKQRFYHDRAVGVVHQTLLYLDKQFEDLGLGAWMPFRWPDQWLSFCGVLNRVLAANGLIHAKHADVYRKLLDETPPVILEGSVWDRVEELKTPINPAKCHMNQGASTMNHLKSRLQSEVWDRQDEEANRPYEFIWPDDDLDEPP